jgi:catechol 2,3-dioxygenase-like lactoylglutathione lyase family enzyme
MAEIDHVHFLCADPDATAEFFRRHFGATEVARIRYPDWLIIRMQLGGTILALSPRRGEQVLADPAEGLRRGFYHVGVRVQGLDALVERLRAAGVPIVGEPRDIDGKVRVAYAAAPDGIELELLEPLPAPAAA